MKTGGVATSTGCPVPRRPAVTVQEHTIAVPTNWVVREDRPSAQRTDHRRAFDVFDAAVRTKTTAWPSSTATRQTMQRGNSTHHEPGFL